MGFILNDEDRPQQRIALSNEVMELLNYDIDCFESAPESRKIIHFLNIIILNYINDSKRCFEKCTKNPEKKVSKKLTINQELRNELEISEKSTQYNCDLKKYIEDIINEYAQLPLSRREQIFKQKEFNAINNSILSNCAIKITLKNNKTSFLFRPYKICSEFTTSYNYVIGYSKLQEPNSNWQIVSVRLLNILKCEPTSTHKEFTSEEKKALHKKIEKVGLAYMAGEHEKIIVKLTSQGFKNYSTWINQRPKYQGITKQNDSIILEFNCTPFQIYNYFFKFGKEAEILEPLELRKKFAEGYIAASEIYNS